MRGWGKVIFALFFTTISPLSSAETLNTDEKAFVQMMVNEHQFDAKKLEQQMASAVKEQSVIEAIKRPWEAKPWHQYYPIFLTDKRLKKGLEFYQAHRETLARAEKTYGVPAEMIVAILGIESFYGTYTGNYSAFNALYTLGFHYPPRKTFFKKEFAQLLLLAEDEKFDASGLKSSYAGALGWGQFIPSSYRHYAVDFDDDGVRDLLNNPVDAIGSIANYFKRNGWKAGEPVAFPVDATSEQAKPWLKKSLKYRNTFQQVTEAGIRLNALSAQTYAIDNAQSQWGNIPADSESKLFDFAQPNGVDYWLGLKNFYVITRYNHSKLYAMVAFQFSRQLAQGITAIDDKAAQVDINNA
ncbi:lytic murein transglycosylase B [uncultured Paraglaciecola sp.]|uniref:lytic murein transglycosylase B n=1 Tax=uncultured Paraglaciecola sp. TaxID=1765024 RepID=UPI0030D9EB9E|tara:strand:+ start:4138 stop:5202 length:1065 start_codon:yes stop_codon:yes gene_type:complete